MNSGPLRRLRQLVPVLPRPVARVRRRVRSAEAAAQVVKPWAPASDDAPAARLQRARAFQRATGDNATGANFDAYDLVAQAARRLMRQLGRDNTRQAPAIETTLDSLGLDTEIAFDPPRRRSCSCSSAIPTASTPTRSASSSGTAAPELRMQGIGFPPCLNTRMRVWWTRHSDTPYEAAILFDRKRGTRVPTINCCAWAARPRTGT